MNLTRPFRPLRFTATQTSGVFLHNAFILPFKDPARAYIYFSSFFFALGSAFLDVFIAIDSSKLGAAELTYFLLGKFVVAMTFIPFGLYCMGRVNDKILYSGFIALMAAGLAAIVVLQSQLSPWQAGLIFAMASAPFWPIYHIMFATATTDKNIGNEVSLSGTGLTVGITVGSLLGGFCSQYQWGVWGLISGFVILIGATLAMIIRAYRSRFTESLQQSGAMSESCFQALKRSRYRSVGAVLEGLFHLPSGNLWLVYLGTAGIAAGAVGAWQAVMVLSKVVATPFAGSLVNHGRRREMLFGSGLNLLGWVPFLFGVGSGFVLLFMNIWAVGMQLFSTGLASVWYSSRTVAAIMVREILMGVGRVAATLALVPILYASPLHFIQATLLISVAIFIYSLLWMRATRARGRVLQIENIVTST